MRASNATFREVGTVTIVDLSGPLMLGESSSVLRRAISHLVGKQRSKIILKFRNVSEIDSAGVGELVAAYTAVRNCEGRLKLLNPPKKNLRDARVHEALENIRSLHEGRIWAVQL